MHFLTIFLSSSNAWRRSNWRWSHIFFDCFPFFRCFMRKSHGHICFCIDEVVKIIRYRLFLLWGLRVGLFSMRASAVRRVPTLRPCSVDVLICAEMGLRLRSCISILMPLCFWVIIVPFYRSSTARSHLTAPATLKDLAWIQRLVRKREMRVIVWVWSCEAFFLCFLRKSRRVCWKWSALLIINEAESSKNIDFIYESIVIVSHYKWRSNSISFIIKMFKLGILSHVNKNYK